MSFQQTVRFSPGFGVQGSLYDDGPVRCEPFQLVSSPQLNVFGNAFSVVAGQQAVAVTGNPGGANIFAGYLVTPKNYALFGSGLNTLAATLVLPDNVEGQLLNMGSIVVSLVSTRVGGGNIVIGDRIIYDNTTGVLSALPPAAALPVGFSYGYAVVDRYTPNPIASGATTLAVIRVTDIQNIPS